MPLAKRAVMVPSYHVWAYFVQKTIARHAHTHMRTHMDTHREEENHICSEHLGVYNNLRSLTKSRKKYEVCPIGKLVQFQIVAKNGRGGGILAQVQHFGYRESSRVFRALRTSSSTSELNKHNSLRSLAPRAAQASSSSTTTKVSGTSSSTSDLLKHNH
eukprot:95814-Amphidinium_carterae.1